MNRSLKAAKIAKITKIAKSSAQPIDMAPHRVTHWNVGLALPADSRDFDGANTSSNSNEKSWRNRSRSADKMEAYKG